MPGRHRHPGGRAVQACQRRRQQQHDHDGCDQGQDHGRGRVQGCHRERARKGREELHAVCLRLEWYGLQVHAEKEEVCQVGQ